MGAAARAARVVRVGRLRAGAARWLRRIVRLLGRSAWRVRGRRRSRRCSGRSQVGRVRVRVLRGPVGRQLGGSSRIRRRQSRRVGLGRWALPPCRITAAVIVARGSWRRGKAGRRARRSRVRARSSTGVRQRIAGLRVRRAIAVGRRLGRRKRLSVCAVERRRLSSSTPDGVSGHEGLRLGRDGREDAFLGEAHTIGAAAVLGSLEARTANLAPPAVAASNGSPLSRSGLVLLVHVRRRSVGVRRRRMTRIHGVRSRQAVRLLLLERSHVGARVVGGRERVRLGRGWRRIGAVGLVGRGLRRVRPVRLLVRRVRRDGVVERLLVVMWRRRLLLRKTLGGLVLRVHLLGRGGWRRRRKPPGMELSACLSFKRVSWPG